MMHAAPWAQGAFLFFELFRSVICSKREVILVAFYNTLGLEGLDENRQTHTERISKTYFMF